MKNKIITIILGPNCDMEAFALRNILEYFGFIVVLRTIGRPNDLIKILQGDDITKISQVLIFCFHGQDGEFIMPQLAEELYKKNEPKGSLNYNHIQKFAKFNGQHIIVTGCTLGKKQLAESFLKANAKTYIGTKKYPEGNAVLIFMTTLFYNYIKHGNYNVAFEKARMIDKETRMFEKYE